MAARKSYRAAASSADDSTSEKKVTIGGIVAVAVDTVLNAGGMWVVVLNLNDTDSYAMFAKSLNFGEGDMRMLPALIIAIALGFVLCVAPHKLWHRSGFADAQQTRRRIASVVAAAGGWYTTWRFVVAVGIGGVAGLVVSGLVEWLLFEFKREVLR